MAWMYGVVLACCGSLFSCIGMNLQRVSQLRNALLHTRQQRPPHKQLLNIIGISLVFVEAIFDMAAYEFSSSTTLAPFSALTMTLNMIVAPFIVGERADIRDIAVTALVFCGTTVAVRFSDHDSPNMKLDVLLHTLLRPTAICVGVLFILWMVALAMIAHRFLPSRALEIQYRQQLMHESYPYVESFDGDVAIEEGAPEPPMHPLMEFISLIPSGRCWRLTSIRSKLWLHRCAMPLLAGSCGSFTALLAKAVNELLFNTVAGDNQFQYVGSWVIVTLLCMAAGLQITLLNMSLRFYESLWVVPLYTSTNILTTSCFTSFILGDLSKFAPLQALGFFIGISLTLIGVSMLMARAAKSPSSAPTDDPVVLQSASLQ